MNDSIIYSALNEVGYTFLRFEKPFHLFKGQERTIGYCLPCGLLVELKSGEKLRRRWQTRTLDEIIAFANEGVTRV